MKVSYYPGCSLHATAKEYDQSVRAVCGALGIELKEIEDWSCCGASSAHMTNFGLSVALPARSLVASEKDGLNVMMVPCAACFNRFKTAQYHLERNKKLRIETENIIGEEYRGTVEIKNPLDVIFNEIGLDTLNKKVTRKLSGLKPVSYYGCLLLRPPEICEFDDNENPYMMDEIMESLGAESRPWSYKTDCCGGSLTLGKTEIVVHLVDKLMRMAEEAGANCLVTACPICMANLDMRASKGMRIPAFYFTELIAVAMDLGEPGKWFKMHNVDPRPLLDSLGLL